MSDCGLLLPEGKATDEGILYTNGRSQATYSQYTLCPYLVSKTFVSSLFFL